MEVSETIPDRPDVPLFFGWFLDTDCNRMAGQRHNDIGSDYKVQVSYDSKRGWIGQIFEIGTEKYTELDTQDVKGESVLIWVPLKILGSPRAMCWIGINQIGASSY